ncbi:HAD family hydrolase [Chloroflexota bacterium]
MIKAVFFDFFNTLVNYQPPREQVYTKICSEHGIHVEPKALARPLMLSDLFWRDEERRSPIDKRTPQEQAAFWSEYIIRALSGAGVEIDQDMALKILLELKKISWDFVTYDDTITTMAVLKERNLTLGLISNAGKNMDKIYEDLGLLKYLDYWITSFEVGYDKPQPEIFQAALQKAQLKAEETLFIGDQYDIDVVGARGVGIKAVLLDRNDWFPEITDCIRVNNLTDLVNHI